MRTLGPASADAAAFEALAGEVWRVSQGNPFMVVETMRAVQGATTPVVAGTLPLPPRVRDVIAARLGRLSETSRKLVAVAAVIRREFEFGLVERVAGLGSLDTAAALEELVRRRVAGGSLDPSR